MNVIYQNDGRDWLRQCLRQWRWLCLLLGLGGLLAVVIATPAVAERQVPAPVAVAPAVAAKARAYFDVAPGCLNLIEGGDFEQFNPSWQLQASTRPPMYSNEQTFNNSLQAMRLGNGLELPNIASVSEVRHKPILLPFGATRIILRFLYFPLYDAAPGADLQQADLFDATTDQLIGSLLNAQEGTGGWKARDFDLTLYAGRSISVRFRVRNDGVAGRTLMYVDNVELEYCAQAPLPTLTPTPSSTPIGTLLPTSTLTPTPSATLLTATPIGATPTPIVVTSTPLPPEDPSCPNILVNGSFEGFDGWHFGEDPVPPRYVNTFFQEGTRSVLLGNPPENPTNVITFSSIRQLVTIPFTTGQVQLRWWRLPHTAQAGGPTGSTDRQDLILLAPNLQPIQILRRELRNDAIWQEDVVDLTPFRGQTLYLYFNAFNDANNARTWLYLDNVRLRVCGAPVVAPTAIVPWVTATPTLATPVAIPLTPNLTYTVIPTLTLSPVSTVAPLFSSLPSTVTATFLPPPVITATIAAALALPALPMPTPTVLATPTNNVYPLPTLPTQTVVEPPTAQAAPLAAISATATPLIVTPIPVISERPFWMDRLGAIAVLVGILVVIGFIVLAIARLFQGRSGP